VRAPRAGGVHDGAALDALITRADRRDSATRHVDRAGRRALAELDAALARAGDVALQDRVRIGVAVPRAESREAHVVDAHLGEDRLGLRSGQPSRRYSEALPERERALERHDVPFLGDEKEVADLMELRVDAHFVPECFEPRQRTLREPDVHLGRELQPDAAGVLAGRPVAQTVALEHDDAAGTAKAEVIRDRRTDDASADDDDVGARHCSGGTADGAIRTITRRALYSSR